MFKLGLLLLLAGSSQALNCAECINEMHGLNFLIKQGAPEIMVRVHMIFKVCIPPYPHSLNGIIQRYQTLGEKSNLSISPVAAI